MLIKKYKNLLLAAAVTVLCGLQLAIPGLAFAATAPASTPAPATSSCDSTAEPGLLGGQAATQANCDPVSLAKKDEQDIGCGNGSNGSYVAKCSIVDQIIKPAILFLTVGFGIIITAIIMLAGVQYSAAGGDPQKVADAKKRIGNAIFALVAYLLLLGALSFLVPGGLL